MHLVKKAKSKVLIVTVSLKISRCGASLNWRQRRTRVVVGTGTRLWWSQAGTRHILPTMTVPHRIVKTAPRRLSSLTLWRPLSPYGYSYNSTASYYTYAQLPLFVFRRCLHTFNGEDMMTGHLKFLSPTKTFHNRLHLWPRDLFATADVLVHRHSKCAETEIKFYRA